MLRLALEALAQHRVLRDAWTGQVSRWHSAHHDAAGRDQRPGREAELVGAEQRADQRLSYAGAQAAIDLQRDLLRRPLSTSVCCVSARPISHGLPACLIEVSGEAPVPPVARDGDAVGARLSSDTRRDGTDANLGDEFHRDLARRVDVLQVVDELCQILDVDVVMRRRRDRSRIRRRVTHLGDCGVHLLVAGQLAALAGLGALRHLDLHHVRVDEIFGRHAEASCPA